MVTFPVFAAGAETVMLAEVGAPPAPVVPMLTGAAAELVGATTVLPPPPPATVIEAPAFS